MIRQAGRSPDAATIEADVAEGAAGPERRAPMTLSLFWRTFVLLVLFLAGSTVAWIQTFRALEHEPRAILTAQQIATLVNLSRAALVHSDAIARLSLIKTLAEQEAVRIVPREPPDIVELGGFATLDALVQDELARRLGGGTTIASRVNGEAGLWVAFTIEGDAYWLRTDPERLRPVSGRTWLIWLVVAAALSLVGAAAIARLINRPLKQLSFAASRVREGDFDASRLDELSKTEEIREVNIGFNRMAQQLAKIEQDRAVMLAGISHDLRTPLARMRLETEMSVTDPVARDHMAADIAQLDAIIDKFLDYARPDQVRLQPVNLDTVVEASTYPFLSSDDIRITVDIPPGLIVLGDEVELIRVLSNLLENARRYGKTPETGVAAVELAARSRSEWVAVRVRDQGLGVAPDVLGRLTKPFFRGDAARTAASGAGLGLAIVEKTVQRMGGSLSLSNGSAGGFVALVRLKKAT